MCFQDLESDDDGTPYIWKEIFLLPNTTDKQSFSNEFGFTIGIIQNMWLIIHIIHHTKVANLNYRNSLDYSYNLLKSNINIYFKGNTFKF